MLGVRMATPGLGFHVRGSYSVFDSIFQSGALIDSRFMAYGLWFMVYGLGFREERLGLRVEGFVPDVRIASRQAVLRQTL
jgi:hypothetical protein